MQRRAFRLIGADGTIDIEIQRIEGGSLDVHETNNLGDAMHPSKVVHEWEAARQEVGRLCVAAINEGRV